MKMIKLPKAPIFDDDNDLNDYEAELQYSKYEQKHREYIGQCFHILRTSANISLRELACNIGCKEHHLTKFEKGKYFSWRTLLEKSYKSFLEKYHNNNLALLKQIEQID